MAVFTGNMNISNNSTVMTKFPGDSESGRHNSKQTLRKNPNPTQFAHCSIGMLVPMEVKQLFVSK